MSCNNTNNTCTNCNYNYSSCNNKCAKCGCKDSFLTSPPPCPTPVGCPTPQPCSEIFDAQCVRYTGTNILCDTDIVVTTNDTVAEALEGIVDYICAETVVSLDIECDTDVVVEQGTTVTDALVDIVDYFCNNTPAPSYTYEIGQYVASRGGVIFHRYKDGTNENYLVVSIANQGSIGWSNITATAIGASASSTWDGLSNSNAIIGQSGFANGAAKLCLDLVSLGINDWYLPSTDELSLLWHNRFNVNKTLSGNSTVGPIAGAGELGSPYYWSSTESGTPTAYSFGFLGGYASSVSGKGDQNQTRAIRKFTI